MTGFSAINLAMVPPPDVVEALDYEAILQEMKDQLALLAPDLAPVLALESEPVVKILEVCAYREVILRARVNDAARAVMLATATGADLDNLAALFGVTRLTISAGNPAAEPPEPPVMETDTALRARAQLALEGFSTAGPVGAYTFHALSAHAEVKDVHVDSPAPGEVRVTVLSHIGDGTPSPAVLAAVAARLNADEVRPLCDLVAVQPATIVTYTINATLEFLEGPDPEVVLAEALTAVTAYAAFAHSLGTGVTMSGLYSALHRPGVARVNLIAPVAELALPTTSAAFCTSIAVLAA
jgi:phage-related baseplate assembly protein